MRMLPRKLLQSSIVENASNELKLAARLLRNEEVDDAKFIPEKG